MSGSGFGGPGRSPAGGEDGGASAYQPTYGALSVYGGGGGGGGGAVVYRPMSLKARMDASELKALCDQA